MTSVDPNTLQRHLKVARRRLGEDPDKAANRFVQRERDPRFAGYLEKQVRHLREALPLVWRFHERAAEAGDAVLVVDPRHRSGIPKKSNCSAWFSSFAPSCAPEELSMTRNSRGPAMACQPALSGTARLTRRRRQAVQLVVVDLPGRFGALTGLRGLSEARWVIWWRLSIMLGVLAILGAILLMAYLIRRKYEQNAIALAELVGQLSRSNPGRKDLLEDRLVFYLRWGALGAMGLITLGLVWMLGSP
jgi:hypothetical protein